jgi:hypothetical protein
MYEPGDVVRMNCPFVIRQVITDQNGLTLYGLSHPPDPDYPENPEYSVFFVTPQDVSPWI